MKKLFPLFFIFLSAFAQAQIYVCKDGVTNFTSEAPLELIKARSQKTNGVLDCATKNVAFSVDIDSFNGFNSELQKEHFRENYIESDKYPKSTFKGKIIEDVDFSKKGTYTVRAKGVFSIHGAEKEKIIKVKINITDKTIDIDANFEVPLEDHDIKIPKVVNQKIASIIVVEVKAALKPKA
ncbi:MAG: YceI family protein [Bacteroidetes bacterium]|nr:YceI family protein [Bacteroidota bacterium]